MKKWIFACLLACCFLPVLPAYSSLNQNCTTYDSLLLLVNNTNDQQQVDVLISLANVVNDTAPETSFLFAVKALRLATDAGYLKGKADARMIIGNYFGDKRKYLPALDFFLGALSIYLKINDEGGILESYRCIGLLYFQLKSYSNALIFYQKGLFLAQSAHHISWMGAFLHNIGHIRQQEGKYQEAYELYNKALLSFHQLGQRNNELEVYNSLGSLLLDQKKYEEALNLYTAILSANDSMPVPFLGTIYTRLAHIFSQKKQYGQSLVFNKMALQARIRSHQQEEANSSQINLAGSFFQLNMKDSAMKYLNEGMIQAKKFNRKNLIENGYHVQYLYRIQTGNFKEALVSFQQYEAMSDSIQDDKIRSDRAIMDENQRIHSIEENNDLLIKEHEIQRLSLRNQNNQLVFLQILIGLACVIILVFLIQYLKNIRRKKELQNLNVKLSREISERETTNIQIREREQKYRFIAEHTVDLITRINQAKQCVYASPSAMKIFGYDPLEILDEFPYGLTHPAFIEYADAQFSEMIRERKPKQFSYLSVKKSGETFWTESLFNPVFDKNTGEFREVVGVIRDIQELKNKEMEIIEGTKQKENLLREIHHRVKNNFAILVSLINMQKEQTQSQELIQSLTNLQMRIRTMALVHEMLYRSKDFEKISFREYLRSLSSVITGAYNSRKIQLHFNVEEVVMDIEAAIPLGLIVNEILSNAYKHAFPDEREGNIWVDLTSHSDGPELSLTIRDDGVGMPHDFTIEHCKSMGIQIVQILVKQIEGEIILINNLGSCFTISFPGIIR